MMVRAAGFAGRGRRSHRGQLQGRVEIVHTEQQQSQKGVEACQSGAVWRELFILPCKCGVSAVIFAMIVVEVGSLCLLHGTRELEPNNETWIRLELALLVGRSDLASAKQQWLVRFFMPDKQHRMCHFLRIFQVHNDHR